MNPPITPCPYLRRGLVPAALVAIAVLCWITAGIWTSWHPANRRSPNPAEEGNPPQAQLIPAAPEIQPMVVASAAAGDPKGEISVASVSPLPPTDKQLHAFAQLQQLLASQAAAGQPQAHGGAWAPLGVSASPAGRSPEEVQRKIHQHLSGASRDPSRAPSPEYFFRGETGSDTTMVINPNHRLLADLSGRGLTVQPWPDAEVEAGASPAAAAYLDAWQVTLELSGFGYEGAVQPAEMGTLEVHLNRAEHLRPGLTEWYVNTGAGLEQGFTLDQPPGERPSPDAPLRLEMSVGTPFASAISEDGTSLALTTPDGATILRYEGLLAFDSTGQQLPAHLEFTDGVQLALVVDDRDARYPVVVDPVVVGLVKDINLATDNSSPAGLVSMGGMIYFTAFEPATGLELWKSDGTAAGTVLVKDIIPGGSSSSPGNLTAVGSTLYFRANDGTSGSELWKSDGTAAGTVLVKDIFPGGSSSSPQNLTGVGSTLYFTANDGTSGSELWKSDGTAAGTVLVKDIRPGNSSSGPQNLTVVGSTLFFRANDGTTGDELWKSDGSAAGTVLVKDIAPGVSSSSPQSLTAVGSTLYFATSSFLWKSDGTSDGTILVKNTASDSGSYFLSNMKAVGSSLFFVRQRTTSTFFTYSVERSLWRSDGTADGTILLANLHFYSCSSSGSCSFTTYSTELTALGSLVYFRTGHSGETLARTDGSPAGTFSVRSFPMGAEPLRFAVLGNELLFSAGGSASLEGRELWKTDGTFAGTILVKDINGRGFGSSPSLLAVVDSTLYFSANDVFTGAELWKSDGTAAGTEMVKDIRPGSISSFPRNLTAVGSTLYFSADDDSTGHELWKSDGTAAGTVLVRDVAQGWLSSNPSMLTAMGGTLYFRAQDGATGEELWKSDGTAAGTVLVKDIWPGGNWGFPQNLTAVGSTLFFTANDGITGSELWKSDGTAAGTVLVKDVLPGVSSSSPQSLTAVGGTLYFTANDGITGSELWKSDGTEVGTVLVKDIVPGSPSSFPGNLTAVGETLFFSASNGSTGNELWKSDGTEAGTVLVKDILPGTPSSSPWYLTALGNMLFFTALEPASGRELWRSDGTANGTVLVKDLWLGGSSADPLNLTAVGDVLFFTAQEPTSGRELWRSDGTAAGTLLAADILPGPGSSSPQQLKVMGDRLFFAANDGQVGQELWYAFDIPNLPPASVELALILIAENQPSGTLVGLLTAEDPDPDDTHTFELVAGDGDTDNALFSIVGNELQTAAVFDFESQSSLSLRVRATDAGGLFVEAILVVQVEDVNEAPVLAQALADAAGTYGQALSLTFPAGTFTDPDLGQTLTYTLSGLPPGLVFDGPTRTVSGAPAAIGDFTVTVTATDDGVPTLAASGSFGLAIQPAALSVAAQDASRAYGQDNPPFTGVLLGVVSGDNITASYVSTATGLSSVGSYAIQPVLHDPDGRLGNYVVTSTDGTLTVNPAAAQVAANAQSKTYGQANPTLDAVVTGEVPGGDSVAYTLATTATQFSGVGTYPITVTLGANPNYTVTMVNSTLTVDPAALEVTIHGPSSGFLAKVHTEIVLSGQFTPTGVVGTYLAYWTFSSATLPPYSEWATIVGDQVQDSFQFPAPGVYLLQLTVMDPSGAIVTVDTVDSDLPAYVVVYDPEGGFVTGGGWIWSPPGAFHPDLEEYAGITGRATFGFVSRYQRGASVPTGNTQFQFQAGNLNFQSSVYEWLVVSGARAQYKGSGRINDQGDYGFLLTAIDGQVTGGGGYDRFRIKIWEKTTGILLYDNQAGAEDNAELEDTTRLGGGSIVVHSPPPGGKQR